MGLSSWAVPSSELQEGFTYGTTVVVLTGLPGDVATERRYLDEIKRLVEILALPSCRPKRLFVLTDSPEAVVAPQDLHAEVSRATRDNFLALGGRLAGPIGPVVVFVWGHGGVQGSAPVFHVRGERLTPQDFRAFASQAAQGGSKWVLCFRQSGAFAQSLRAPGRELMSSENSLAFTSDPVGLSLLLRSLREAPGLPFSALAERWGPSTASWYEQQQLARTEDPTLWIGEASPRLLSKAEGPQKPAVATQTATGAWTGISTVDPAAFPRADAVMLRKRQSYTLGENPALVEETDEFIQVLTAEGKRFGDFDIAYSPPEERMSFLDCEVRRGVLVTRMDPEAIHEASVPAMGDYRPPSRKIFSFPHVEPGAVLRVHSQREWKHFPLPHIPLELPLALSIPVLDSQVEIHLARDSAFHFAFRNVASEPPKVEQTSYGTTYSWHFRDLSPMGAEVLVHPNRAPTLLFSTFPDWASFSSWYRRLIREADQVTPEISSAAAELTSRAKTDRERVLALYNFVTGLRYVAVPLGVNSYRPHAAANVLRNRYGDCKDKANLFNTLLRTQGIAADLVLVPRFSQAFEETPGLSFNHAISRVRLGGEVLWVDTTDDISRFGLLPPGDPGRKVLVVEEGSKGLTELPAPAPSAHKIWLKERIEKGAPDRWVSALEVKSTGYADYELRWAARAAAGEPTTRPVLSEAYRPVAGLFEMQRQSHTPTSDLERDFAWNADGAWAGLAGSVTASQIVRAPFWMPREWETAIHKRRLPLYLNQGYPLAMDQEIQIRLPPGASRVLVPASQADEKGPLRWRVDWLYQGGDKVTAHLVAELSRGELSWEETVAFQSQLAALMGTLGEGVSYTP